MRSISLAEANSMFGDNLTESRKVFFWDHRTYNCVESDTEDFFGRLEESLRPVGLEVVRIEFDGDAFPWFIDNVEKS